MKKVLFATTALIATASMAAADVKIGGYGRFGLDYNSANGTQKNGLSKTSITSRLRIQFDMSTEADNGVGFNARVRMQSESRDGNPSLSTPTGASDNGFNGARFGVTYGGLMVNVGNIIGAIENTPGLYTTGTRSAGTGIDGMGFNSLAVKGAAWDAYSSDGIGANGVEALYSAGGFTGHVSYSERNCGTAPAACGAAKGESRTGIMLTYSFGNYYVAGSYQDSQNGPTLANGKDTNDIVLVAAGGDFGQFGARIAYGSTEAADAVTIEGNMDLGTASNVLVWVNNSSPNKFAGAFLNTGIVDGTSYGVNYQYDLGGGATFVAGYVHAAKNNAGASSTNQAQAGVYFSF